MMVSPSAMDFNKFLSYFHIFIHEQSEYRHS